jgi:hypothetical protein
LSAAEQQKNVAAVEQLGERIGVSPALQPAQFIRGLARQWKQFGGTTAAGKARHSDRYLDSLLRGQGTPIRSLIPKLGGRTNFKPADASILARFFLSHWQYVGAPDEEVGENFTDLYEPLFPDDQIEQVSRYVAEHIARAQEKTGRAANSTARTFRSSPGIERKNQYASDLINGAPLRSLKDVMVEEFKQATAVFSVSGGQTLLATQQPELLSFKAIINEWWKIDKDDALQRTLIWTLDFGRLDFNDPESRARFMNVSALRARFKAMEILVDADADARWKWLQSKTVIVLHDTRHVRPDRPMLPTFDPNHVLFSAIPPRWARSPDFFTLYSRDRLQETTHTVFLREAKGEPFDRTNLIAEVSEQKLAQNCTEFELRYFAHGLMGRDADEPKSVGLSSPGQSYVDALGTVFLAAAEFLKLPEHSEVLIEGLRIDKTDAIDKLRHHGFILLRLDEFMKAC